MSAGLTALEVAGLVLSSEFALIAIAVPAWLLRRQHRQISSQIKVDTVATQTLLEAVEAKAPSRRDALSTIFATTYQMQGQELDAKVDEFVAREQAFYQVMTRVYLERDGDSLQAIPEELTKVISPWLRLTPRNMVDSATFSALESTNAELSTELDETKRSMADLMNEYMRAFDKGRAFEDVIAKEDAALESTTGTSRDRSAEPAVAAQSAAKADTTTAEITTNAAALVPTMTAATATATATSATAPALRAAPAAAGPDITRTASAAVARQSPLDETDDGGVAIDDIVAAPEMVTDDDIEQLLAEARAPVAPTAVPIGPAEVHIEVDSDDIDDILAQARVASAPQAAEINYIDVSEDPEEVAFSQDDLDALTSLFESEPEDTVVAAASA